MARSSGTTRSGEQFSLEVRWEVWKKATAVPGLNANEWRLDPCNQRIAWDQYGSIKDGGAGWEIDHIKPVAQGGLDNLANLQPLHWKNNRGKSDSYPKWTCAVVSSR